MVAPARNADRPRRDVARAASIAEAGYLATLLSDAGVDASTRRADSFDAVTGAWSETYVLSVATDELATAAAVLHAEGDHAAGAGVPRAAATDRLEESPGVISPWRMLTVLTIAAASLAWAVSHRVRPIVRPAIGAPAPERSPARPSAELASALSEAPRGWISLDGSRRLVRTPDGRHWSLAIDTDGDGRPDAARRYVADTAAAR
ncbi:MAG: hypothetical protein AAF805_15020 [Planctomycetota bacterium]